MPSGKLYTDDLGKYIAEEDHGHYIVSDSFSSRISIDTTKDLWGEAQFGSIGILGYAIFGKNAIRMNVIEG